MTADKYSVDILPELPLEPLELAGKLEHAGTAPVLMITPRKMTALQPPAKPTAKVKKAEVYKRTYLTQITYPQVVCYPQNELWQEVSWQIRKMEAGERDVEVLARYEGFYKLTSFNGVKLEKPYLCTVHYGPWSAVVTEQESCIDGEPNHFTLVVASIPELELSWYGAWDDIPSYPSLHVIKGDLYLVKEEFMCCPGYKWCSTTMSCIPEAVNCEPPIRV